MMKQSTWNGLGVTTSLLGFGCMRFPVTAEGQIDEEKAAAMLQAARDAGVNYFDTAWFYHSGESENFLGRFLQRWPRDSYYLATKMPPREGMSLELAKETFETQCKKLQTDHFDFYLLHSMTDERYKLFKELGIVDWCQQLKEEGRIRYYGFSFHDDYEAFETILNDRDWDFCQIQYNYMDNDTQAGDKGYELTVKKNVPVIVMEPVKGGTLAALPEDAAAPLKALRPDASLASWAMRWVGSRENVKMILSGMTTMEQVQDNLSTFTGFAPLTAEEEAAVAQTRAILNSRVRNGCTGCRYCMPCPAGVNIPGSFSLWNSYGMYRNTENAKKRWANLDAEKKPVNCIECGACEGACPQHLPIREQLKQLQAEMDAL